MMVAPLAPPRLAPRTTRAHHPAIVRPLGFYPTRPRLPSPTCDRRGRVVSNVSAGGGEGQPARGGGGGAVAVPWYATTPARTFGLAGLLKVFLFTFPNSTFPVMMLASGKGVAVGAAQSAVALVGGLALASLASRLDRTDVFLRARRGALVLLAGCVALAVLVARLTPVDGALAAEMMGRRPAPVPTARAAAAQPTPASLAPPTRRTAGDSDAEYERAFGVAAVEAGKRRRGVGSGRPRPNPLLA